MKDKVQTSSGSPAMLPGRRVGWSRVRSETGARAAALAVAIAAAAVVLVTFIFTTLIHEPAPIVTLLGVFLLSIGLDLGWKRIRAGRARPVAAGH